MAESNINRPSKEFYIDKLKNEGEDNISEGEEEMYDPEEKKGDNDNSSPSKKKKKTLD
jgi:hypothetical protein